MTVIRLKPSPAILSKKPPQPGSPFPQQAKWNQSGFWTIASGYSPWKHLSFQQGLGHSLAREACTYNSLYILALIWAIRLTSWLMLPFHSFTSWISMLSNCSQCSWTVALISSGNIWMTVTSMLESDVNQCSITGGWHCLLSFLTQAYDFPNVLENSLSHSANSSSIELMIEKLSKYGIMHEIMESRATMKGWKFPFNGKFR